MDRVKCIIRALFIVCISLFSQIESFPKYLQTKDGYLVCKGYCSPIVENEQFQKVITIKGYGEDAAGRPVLAFVGSYQVPKNHGVPELEEIRVCSGFQRRGIGAACCAEIRKDLKKLGHNKMICYASPIVRDDAGNMIPKHERMHRDEVIKFHQANGGKIVKEYKNGAIMEFDLA